MSEKKLNIRQKVSTEVMTSEQSYVKSLRICEEYYIKPLIQCSTDPQSRIGMNPEHIPVLFSNMQLILNFNEKFLADLEKRMADWSESTCISDLFLQFAPFFKMYTQYVSNHDKATQLLSKLNERTEFASFASKCQLASKDTTNTLSSYLIMPIQRIPRYKLLLAELIRHTEHKHADYTGLHKALDEVSVVATSINEALHRDQTSREMLDLQNQFLGRPQLVSPGRRLVRQGELEKLSRSTSTHDRTYQFFLFNDLLLYAADEPVRKALGLSAFSAKIPVISGQYKIHGQLPINKSFFIQDLPEKSDEKPFRFQVISFKKSFILAASDEQTKRDWLTELYACIKHIREMLIDSSHDITTAPVLQPKSVFERCQVCEEAFSFFKRKQHCQYCGSVVCDACSQRRFVKQHVKDYLRVCDKCVMQICKSHGINPTATTTTLSSALSASSSASAADASSSSSASSASSASDGASSVNASHSHSHNNHSSNNSHKKSPSSHDDSGEGGLFSKFFNKKKAEHAAPASPAAAAGAGVAAEESGGGGGGGKDSASTGAAATADDSPPNETEARELTAEESKAAEEARLKREQNELKVNKALLAVRQSVAMTRQTRGRSACVTVDGSRPTTAGNPLFSIYDKKLGLVDIEDGGE